VVKRQDHYQAECYNGEGHTLLPRGLLAFTLIIVNGVDILSGRDVCTLLYPSDISSWCRRVQAQCVCFPGM